jgi:hypothetical protein
MHTSYKELNSGITRKARRDIKPQTKNRQHKSSSHKQRPKDLKQNESRMRTESWHRVRRRDMKKRVNVE